MRKRDLREGFALVVIGALAIVYAPHCWGQLSQTAAPPSVEFIPAPNDIEKRIETQLDAAVEFAFVETPLEEVMAFLRDTRGIEVQLDMKALDDSAIAPDSPVTLKIEGISLRSALRQLLSRIGLTWIVRDELLLITTREVESGAQSVRVYPVWDLAPKREDLEHLATVIRKSVKPMDAPWSDVGGLGEVQLDPGSRSLVITQTQNTHTAILDLLRSLRQARKVATQQLNPQPRISQAQ